MGLMFAYELNFMAVSLSEDGEMKLDLFNVKHYFKLLVACILGIKTLGFTGCAKKLY